MFSIKIFHSRNYIKIQEFMQYTLNILLIAFEIQAVIKVLKLNIQNELSTIYNWGEDGKWYLKNSLSFF